MLQLAIKEILVLHSKQKRNIYMKRDKGISQNLEDKEKRFLFYVVSVLREGTEKPTLKLNPEAEEKNNSNKQPRSAKCEKQQQSTKQRCNKMKAPHVNAQILVKMIASSLLDVQTIKIRDFCSSNYFNDPTCYVSLQLTRKLTK